MRSLRIFLLPCVFLIGLAFFAYQASSLFGIDVPCNVGSCPLTLYEGDSEEVFIYRTSDQFSVVLDDRKNPRTDLHCRPDGVIDVLSFTQATPLYTVVFKGVASGACLLENNTFSAMIVVQ